MNCARNIITANFSGGGTSATTAPLWQWDYGQVLCITGIEDLPAAFEVHFSTNRTGGVSTVAVGADGQVTIPNELLTIGKNLNAWIYLSDAQGEGETEYSITIPVKARPMPETYDAEVTGEFDDVVRQVSEYAQTAQTAADNAGASASAAAASADNAAASASAAETAKTAAETAQAGAEDAQAAAETAAQTATEKAQQTAQDAAQAASDAGKAESAAQRAEAAQTGAESAKTDAETAAQGAADSASAASTSATSAGQSATSAGQSATAAAGSATTAGNAAQTATTKAAEAFASADAAAASETAAETAQTAAETAATNAGQSASTATTKAAEAAQSASNAAASETAAEAAATRAERAAASIVVDDALSDTSENPVQNKVITGEVTQLKNALNSSLDFLALEQGNYNTSSGNPLSLSNYVRSTTKIVDKTHIATGNSSIYVAGIFIYNDDGSFEEYINPGQQITNIDINPGSGKYALFSMKSSDNSNVTPGDIQPNLTMTKLLDIAKEVPANSEALMDITDATGNYTRGYGIVTSQSIGTVINVTPAQSSVVAYAIIPCKYKDKFTITGTGVSSYRLWCFVDENYRSKSVSVANAIATNLELIAPCDGYFITNVTVAQSYSLKVYQRIDIHQITERLNEHFPEYVRITNPHYLFWRMGAFDANGPQGFSGGMLVKDRFFTVVKVKAGSKVSKKGMRSKNISFGYKLSESDATLTGFISNAGDSIIIDQDCIAYIGIRYSNPVADLLNDSILDEFDFDLLVVDYKSRYSRGEGIKDAFVPSNGYAFPRNYGNPCPEFYYEGQHADTTGWTNSFSDIAAIYNAFDALVASSGSYLVKKVDYGVAYTGNAGNTDYDASSEWHLYEYATVPINASVDSVPKVAITCTMHGNEKMSTYAMYYLMYDLIHNAEKNPVLSWMKANCIITFIPICNPYGFMKATPSRLNENGVNLNRNFPTYNWSEWEDTRTDGNGSEPGGLNYKGESAASESETKMMMGFYRNNYDAVFAIDLHTNGADTVSRDMVSAYMRALPQDTSDLNYKLLDSFLPCGKTFTNRIRPWLNGEYNAGISYAYAVGTTNPIDYYPCAPQWVRESAGIVGVCYEVLAGSSNGFLGDQLTVYSPAAIKAAAENLGNFIISMLAHCKTLV